MNKYIIDVKQNLNLGYFTYGFDTEEDAKSFMSELRSSLPHDPIVADWMVGGINPGYNPKEEASKDNPKFIPV